MAKWVVDISGRSIGVVNIGGEYFAIMNRCPHQGPLCLGNTLGFLRFSGVGEFDYRRAEVLRYPVSVVPGFEGLQKGPYVAETFPVSVEQQTWWWS